MEITAAAASPFFLFCGGGITTCTLLLRECFADAALPFFAAIAFDELLDFPLPMIAVELRGCGNGIDVWMDVYVADKK